MTFTVSEKRNSCFMMTVDWLFSWSRAGLSHDFILKWSFNWVSHTNKRGDKRRHENNLSLWEAGRWSSVQTVRVFPAVVCSFRRSHLKLKEKKKHEPGRAAFMLGSFVNSHVSCVILREGSNGADTLFALTHVKGNEKHKKKRFWVKLWNHVGTRPRRAVSREFLNAALHLYSLFWCYCELWQLLL